jgi:hypothetical protein
MCCQENRKYEASGFKVRATEAIASYSEPINITFKEIYFLVLTRDITSVTAANEVNVREEIMTRSCNVELKKIPSITQRIFFFLPVD